MTFDSKFRLINIEIVQELADHLYYMLNMFEFGPTPPPNHICGYGDTCDSSCTDFYYEYKRYNEALTFLRTLEKDGLIKQN